MLQAFIITARENSEALHLATEPYGPDGTYGKVLSYLLVAVPLAWLGVSSVPRRGGAAHRADRVAAGR